MKRTLNTTINHSKSENNDEHYTQGRRTSLATTRDGVSWDVTRWAYDPRTGSCVSKTYADGSAVAYSYTPDNLPLRTTYASGRWIENVYDERRQVVGTVSCDGSADAVLARDADGRLVAASNALAVVSYAYTSDGLDAGYSLTLTGGVTFTRTVTRDPFRRELATRVGSGVNGVPVTSLAYAYDAMSRPVSRNADSFTYNARGEVVFSLRGAEDAEEAYSYDGIGNLLSSSVNADTNAYAANCVNQYTSVLRVSASASRRSTSTRRRGFITMATVSILQSFAVGSTATRSRRRAG